ncbi:protein MOS2-like [Miscanthus floridulus]|uniref:protein MOS2-like n=1 Tax=Miscanthus floridulus TaxID=154761 RepID=UPI003457EC0A
MEKQGKLSFSIPTQRRRLIKPPACLAAVADEGTGSRSTPAPQFITEFGPSETPAIIEEAGIVFTRAPDDNPRSSSHAYGLNLPSAPAAAMDKNKAPPHQVTTTTSELLRRRFKQDIAALSDHRDTEEYPKFSAKAFAAAVLAGYGWSKGQGIGRNNKKKGDTKVFSCGRRPGTGAQRQTFGLGYNPEISGAGKKRKRQDTREQERVCSARPRRG